MAEPRYLQFDANQRSVGGASRRRSACLWIALSLALHGALILFALVGAARGGHSEWAGTFEVTVVGAPSAGEPAGAENEKRYSRPESGAVLRRPEAPPAASLKTSILVQPAQPTVPEAARPAPSAPDRPPVLERPPTTDPPDPTALPRPMAPAQAASSEPRPAVVDQAPKRPRAPATISNAPTLQTPKAAREATAKPRAAPRAGLEQAPPGQTASLGSPQGGERLGRSDSDDASGMLSVNLRPRFRSPPPPPVYPKPSIEREEEGVVLVRALVDPAGAPQRVVIWQSSGFALLDEAALEAVQGWRFEPMVRDGRAAASWVQVPVRFRLN